MSVWKEPKPGNKGNAAAGTPKTKTNVVPKSWWKGKKGAKK
tara:strand:- start:1440 stop:1562 length:123 start_codon:yes stop_codon:yes gene_type:complete